MKSEENGIERNQNSPFLNYIWDFDGTLFNTYPTMLKALKMAMDKHDIHYSGDLAVYIKQFSIKQFAENYGNPAFLEDYHQLEHDLQMQTPPVFYAEIQQILQNIVANGGQNFVLSHRDATTYDYLGKWQTLFTEIITSKQPFARKPSPEALLYLIEKYQLDKTVTVMVGDRPLDVEAGKNAGISTLLLDENNLFGQIADIKYKKWSEWK